MTDSPRLDRELLGECLMRVRLALTAMDLWNGAEAQRIHNHRGVG